MKIGSSNLGPTTAGRPRRPSFTLALSAGLAVSVAGMIALAFPEPASAGEAGPAPNVTILIYNYAQATHAVLAGAEREAGRIFAEAGVRTLWFECPAVQSSADPQAPCQKVPESPKIRLQLLSAPVRSKSRDSVWGLAVREGWIKVQKRVRSAGNSLRLSGLADEMRWSHAWALRDCVSDPESARQSV